MAVIEDKWGTDAVLPLLVRMVALGKFIY